MVAAFVGVGDEPDTGPLLGVLAAAGATVLLPVVAADRGLDWAAGGAPGEPAGELRPGRYGLLEPAGLRLGPAALGRAGLVLVPALAVDRAGHRLGRGGGYYDRALAAATAPVLAVVHDDEVLDAVPVEPHDRRVDGALCPAGVVWATGRTAPGPGNGH